jgi:hypothetical protein
MVEFPNIFPVPRRVACLTAHDIAIGFFQCHAIFKLSAMGIGMATCTGDVGESESEGGGGLFWFIIPMAIPTNDCRM